MSHLQMRRALLAVGVVAVCIPLLLTACESRKSQYHMKLDNTSNAALHAVHAERLEQLMRTIENLRSESLPPEYETEAYRNRKKDEMVAAAQELADTAHKIPEVLPEGELDEDEHKYMMELIRDLEEGALELKKQAEKRNIDGMYAAGDRIIATCNACHTAFRLQPLDIKPTRRRGR